MTLINEVYNKLGYYNILQGKNEKEIDLLSNYLLPIRLNDNQNTAFICTCGYSVTNTKNNRCFVCNKESVRNINLRKKQSIVPFSYNSVQKYYLHGTKQNQKITMSYLKGTLNLNIEEDKVLVDVSQLEKDSITISIKDDDYQFLLNEEPIELIKLLFTYDKEIESLKETIIFLIEKLNKKTTWFEKINTTYNNEKLKIETKISGYQDKVKALKNTNHSLQRDYQNKIHDLRVKVKSLTITYMNTVLYKMLNHSLFTQFDKDLNNLLTFFDFYKNKGNYTVTNNDYYYRNTTDFKPFFTFLKNFLNKKELKEYSLEKVIGLDKECIRLFHLLNFDNSKIKSLKNLNKKQKENVTYLSQQYENKLVQFNFNSTDWQSLVLIYKKEQVDIDTLLEYIAHIEEHEGMTASEIISYYYDYIRKVSKEKYKEVPFPVNLKLNARLGGK